MPPKKYSLFAFIVGQKKKDGSTARKRSRVGDFMGDEAWHEENVSV